MVLVGIVTRAHGLRGQLVVKPLTDFAETRFAVGATLWLQREGVHVPITVTALRFQGGRPVIALAGVETVEGAEPLIGCELRIPEAALQPLETNTYYRHQLVGCEVATVAGEPAGRVADVIDGGGGSLLIVHGPLGEVLVPLAADICVTIDIGARRIVIAPPEGLLDLNG